MASSDLCQRVRQQKDHNEAQPLCSQVTRGMYLLGKPVPMLDVDCIVVPDLEASSLRASHFPRLAA